MLSTFSHRFTRSFSNSTYSFESSWAKCEVVKSKNISYSAEGYNKRDFEEATIFSKSATEKSSTNGGFPPSRLVLNFILVFLHYAI